MIPIITNPCGHPHCMEWECEYCRYFKPRLFGFIPVPRKLGEWLILYQEERFLKQYFKTHDGPIIEEDDFDDT